MSQRVNASFDTQPATLPSTDVEVVSALARIRRNPMVHTFDKTDLPAARKFKAHKAVADSIAQDLRVGDMFAFVQPTGRGFWSTEWTVSRVRGGTNVALRRRAATGTTVTKAIDAMLLQLSFDSSHYYRPEEGLIGWYRRK